MQKHVYHIDESGHVQNISVWSADAILPEKDDVGCRLIDEVDLINHESSLKENHFYRGRLTLFSIQEHRGHAWGLKRVVALGEKPEDAIEIFLRKEEKKPATHQGRKVVEVDEYIQEVRKHELTSKSRGSVSKQAPAKTS